MLVRQTIFVQTLLGECNLHRPENNKYTGYKINCYKSALEKIQFLINYGVVQIMGVVHIFVWLKYRISFGQ